MPGMKQDCGGAAAVLGAFSVAVKSGFKVRSKIFVSAHVLDLDLLVPDPDPQKYPWI